MMQELYSCRYMAFMDGQTAVPAPNMENDHILFLGNYSKKSNLTSLNNPKALLTWFRLSFKGFSNLITLGSKGPYRIQSGLLLRNLNQVTIMGIYNNSYGSPI